MSKSTHHLNFYPFVEIFCPFVSQAWPHLPAFSSPLRPFCRLPENKSCHKLADWEPKLDVSVQTSHTNSNFLGNNKTEMQNPGKLRKDRSHCYVRIEFWCLSRYKTMHNPDLITKSNRQLFPWHENTQEDNLYWKTNWSTANSMKMAPSLQHERKRMHKTKHTS